MSTVAYWKIRARLLRVPGVAQVAIWGERLPQRHVQVDPAKLAKNDVTLQQVMDSTADALDAGLLRYSDGAVVGTGGFVESGGTAATTSGTSSRSSAPSNWVRCRCSSATARRCGWPIWAGCSSTPDR